MKLFGSSTEDFTYINDPTIHTQVSQCFGAEKGFRFDIHPKDADLLIAAWDYVVSRETGDANQNLGSPQMITYLINGLPSAGSESGSSFANKQWDKFANPTEIGHYEDMAALAPLNLTRSRIEDLFTISAYPSLQARFSTLLKAKLNLEVAGIDVNDNIMVKLQVAALAMTREPVLNKDLHELYWRRGPRIRKYRNDLFPIRGILQCNDGSFFGNTELRVYI